MLLLTLAALFTAGCDDDDAGTSPRQAVDGIRLLGLVNNRSLLYLQNDTVTTFFPTYSRRVTNTTRVLSIAGTGEDWVLRDGSTAIANLKVSGQLVLHNGVWKSTDGGDSLIYYTEPPVVMQRGFEQAVSWDGFTPWYPAADGDTRYPFFNIYFGFFYERRYAGTDNLVVPAGSYPVYRFDVDLYFDQMDSIPDATATEYYNLTVGLVKLRFNGQGLNRTISLISVQ